MKLHALNDFYWVGICRCSMCFHSWVGVIGPLDPDTPNPPPMPLECSQCGKMSGLTTDEKD